MPLKRATGPAVSNFIRDIICRFGIPKRIRSDNGTPFINSNVRELCEKYGVDHVKSTPYYPQGNGQAEATNKTLMRILRSNSLQRAQAMGRHFTGVMGLPHVEENLHASNAFFTSLRSRNGRSCRDFRAISSTSSH